MGFNATDAPGVARAQRPREAMADWPDDRLLRQFLHPSDPHAEVAFAVLIERHGPMVHRVCLGVLGDREGARDATQAVFLVLARKARSIRKPGSLGPWLHGVALRVARRARASEARRTAAERRNAEIAHQRQASSKGPEPMDHADLDAEIHRLPEKYRRPILLCYMQGFTQTQAATALGWPLGTVQTRLHRGRQRLRSRLNHQGAGLAMLTGPDLARALAVEPVAFEPGWAGTTARAATRFAAGRGMAGLVEPAVERLAESALRAMVVEPLKVLAKRAIPLVLLASAGLVLLRPAPELGRAAVAPAVAKEAKADAARPAPIPEADGPDPAPTDVPATPARVLDDDADRPNPAPPPPAAPENDALLAFLPDSPGRVRAESPDPTPPGPGAILDAGRELFERAWVPGDRRGRGGDGLGPVYNGQSCVSCHDQGGTGGAGGAERNIEIASLSENAGFGFGAGSGNGTGFFYAFRMDFGAGRFEYRMGADPQAPAGRRGRAPQRQQPRTDPAILAAIHPGFRDARSVVLHRFGTDPEYHAWRGTVPGRHGAVQVRTTERNPPPLFGAGLIDAIPDEVIEEAARRRMTGTEGVRGRVSRLADGRVGRFGWKAQVATLKEFVVSAAASEIGLEVPGQGQAADPRLPGLGAPGLDMDDRDCEALVTFVRDLPAPEARIPADESEAARIEAGAATFRSIGCTDCHLPKLGDVEGIYSDLLLHEMSPRLADAGTYSVFTAQAVAPVEAAGAEGGIGSESSAATGGEWRTPPLWGLRDSAPYLHDGRATSIEQAILMHEGQGTASARRYARLSARRREQLQAFLLSLGAPRQEGEASEGAEVP